VAVRTLFSGISRGTESLVFSGRVPRSEWQRMRAPYQEGEFPGPVKYGYASVGRVCSPGELEGRDVFVLYPHQTHYVVPRASVHPLPENVPAGRAVLGANLETAINGAWDAQPRVGDRIAVIGAGAVGCLVAWLLGRIPGCRVQLVDINAAREHTARSLGVAFALPQRAEPDADLVVHASGSPEGLTLALELAGFEATILEMSWFGDRAATVPLGGAFHSKRLRLVSSQVGQLPASQRSRWSTHRRMQLALELLRDPALDVLITGECTFDELPEVMARLAAAPGGALCHRIRYPEPPVTRGTSACSA
jgi:threonine dehydrogenase-like Zn-dependent dehydrogenase